MHGGLSTRKYSVHLLLDYRHLTTQWHTQAAAHKLETRTVKDNCKAELQECGFVPQSFSESEKNSGFDVETNSDVEDGA